MVAPFDSLWLGVFGAAGMAVLGFAAYRRERRIRYEQREGAERLELALAGADLGLWDWDVPSGRVTTNARWLGMLGYDPGSVSVSYDLWTSLLHPDDLPGVAAIVQAHLRGDTPGYEAVFRMRHQAGHWLWVLARGKVMHRDASGGPLRVLGTHADVTQDRLAKDALRDSEARATALFHNLPAGAVVHAPDTRVLAANPQACLALGLTEDQMCGRAALDPVWALMAEDGTPLPLSQYPVNVVAASGEPLDGLLVGVRRPGDADLTWVMCSGYPVKNPDGVLQQIVITFVDVTARKRIQEDLRRSEERLRLILQGSNDAPWDWNLQTGELFHAPRWWRMLGYEPDALPVSQRLWETLIHPDDLDAVKAEMALHLREGPDAYVSTFRFLHVDGHAVPIESRGFISRDAEGRAVRISGVNTDLTERRKAEAERMQLEAQLRESQKMESIGTLAGGIAHDFNNILGAILGNAGLAKAELQPSHPAMPSLDQITKAASRARELVQQILAFSRRQPQALKNQALRPLIQESLALLRATLPASVTLGARLLDEPVVVHADAAQLQQVVVNLCTNAWHALHGEVGRIEVGLDCVNWHGQEPHALAGLPAGRYAHLWVEDTGVGIDKTVMQRIFEPFFTTKPVGSGTGLGLSVVHGIVVAHHGAITVDSIPNHGSIFHVYLPLAAGAVQETSEAEPTLSHMSVEGGGQRVVYVDDDEIMNLMVDRLLSRSGYQVKAFQDPRLAVDYVGRHPDDVDLVVTDFNMPGMTGLDVARAVNALPGVVPVIIATGYISDELVTQADALGVRALLQKENTLEELGGLVRQILSAHVDLAGEGRATS